MKEEMEKHRQDRCAARDNLLGVEMLERERVVWFLGDWMEKPMDVRVIER
jgi:hypothetical protein